RSRREHHALIEFSRSAASEKEFPRRHAIPMSAIGTEYKLDFDRSRGPVINMEKSEVEVASSENRHRIEFRQVGFVGKQYGLRARPGLQILALHDRHPALRKPGIDWRAHVNHPLPSRSVVNDGIVRVAFGGLDGIVLVLEPLYSVIRIREA